MKPELFKKTSAYFSDRSSFPGLAMLNSSQNIDALITDIALKTATHGGYEFSRRAIEQRPSLRVLYTSGSARKQHDIIGRYPVPSSFKSHIEGLFESV